MKIKSLVLAMALLPVFSVAYAAKTNDITKIFPFAAQSHDQEGELEMESGTYIKGSNNHQLDFKKEDDDDEDDDDIEGECDDKQCTLTNELSPSYSLSWNANWKWQGEWQPNQPALPDFDGYSSGGTTLTCDSNQNKNAILADSVYREITVTNKCTISAQADVKIKNSVEVSGSGTLYLSPGSYWMDSLELDGSGKIKTLGDGVVNLYVKDDVDLGGSQSLGSHKNPINIFYYGSDDFELQGSVKLMGSLTTRAKLKMSGSSELNYLVQAKSIELQNSAKLTLLPGDYWFDTLKLSGSTEINQPKASDINLYVKDDVDIKISELGKADRRVNINNYNKNVDLGGSLTWYGDLNTHDELELDGSSKLYGAVRAKSLDLQGSAELHLTAGEYWYEDVELQGSSKIKLVGDRLTHFHILDELELEGSSSLNESGESLLVFVYGDGDDDKDDGDVDLEGSSTIHGHLYVQGEVELQGSSKIYGAVNVVDLEMEGSSAIIYRKLTGVSSKLSHYQLDYIGNNKNGSVSLLACADDNCSQYQDEVADVVVRDAVANKNIISFDIFTGSSKSQPISINNCVEFTLAKSEPWPSSSPSLRCYINGQKIANCKLCDEPIPLYGYVFGQAEMPQVSANDEEQFEIVSYEGPAGLADVNDQSKQLKKGTKLTLPLFVTLEQAGVIELVLQDEDKRDYPVTLRFAPKSLAWEQKFGTDRCGDNGFEYASHNKTCVVLGAAGQEVTLTLQAYGEEDEHGQPQLIANYQDRLASEQMKVAVIELNAEHTAINSNSQAVQKFDFVSKQGQGHKVQYLPKKISLVKATVYRHYSSYGKNEHGSGVKFTKGDSQIIGRIVPGHLYIKKVMAGKVDNDIVYRAKPVEFSLLPKYEVIGCTANNDKKNCIPLPSYTGEFAKGLEQADSLEFVVANDASGDFRLTNNDTGKVTLDHNSNVEPEIEIGIGTHTIEPNPALELIVAKQAAKPTESIEQDLRLKIRIATDATPQNGPLLGNGDAKLAKDAQLRYGFLKIHDTELFVNNDSGLMDTSLLYYGASTDSIEEDDSADYKLTDYNLTVAGGNLILDPEADSPSLSIENDNVNSIKVMPNKGEQASGAWRGDVLIKNTPPKFKWLKPYNDATGELTDPKGLLIISDRKRGSDRVFNRREVVR